MTGVLDQVRYTIEQHSLLSGGRTLVVGVSGGADSLCLLHVLCRLRGQYGLSLHVAHLHHGLRGTEASADAQFVRAIAADWGLPCTVESADVPSLAASYHLSVEEAARRARYRFLTQVAESVGARTAAVGHNADDQAETVLMHWLRGSGLAGLRGMLPITRLADYRLFEGYSDWELRAESQTVDLQASRRQRPGPYLIRPLLRVPRVDIEAYCDFYGLEPRFDLSNLDTTYFRNWLRHEVLPLLETHNPNVRQVLRRSARVIAGDYELLRSLLEETWPRVVAEEDHAPDRPRIAFDLGAWRALPTSLQRSTLREAIHRLRRSLRNINFLHVENALLVARDGTTGDQATLPSGLMLTVGYDRFSIAEASTREPLPDLPLLPAGGAPLAVTVPGTTPLPGSDWRLVAELSDKAGLPGGWAANPDPWRAFLDAVSAGQVLSLRTRRPGDRFQPLGMDGQSVKLADFLTNCKAPRIIRDRLPLLVVGERILWVCGQRVDERARVQSDTEQVLLLRFAR
jgi:tRNA(Ile)-lysidine synthase